MSKRPVGSDFEDAPEPKRAKVIKKEELQELSTTNSPMSLADSEYKLWRVKDQVTNEGFRNTFKTDIVECIESPELINFLETHNDRFDDNTSPGFANQMFSCYTNGRTKKSDKEYINGARSNVMGKMWIPNKLQHCDNLARTITSYITTNIRNNFNNLYELIYEYCKFKFIMVLFTTAFSVPRAKNKPIIPVGALKGKTNNTLTKLDSNYEPYNNKINFVFSANYTRNDIEYHKLKCKQILKYLEYELKKELKAVRRSGNINNSNNNNGINGINGVNGSNNTINNVNNINAVTSGRRNERSLNRMVQSSTVNNWNNNGNNNGIVTATNTTNVMGVMNSINNANSSNNESSDSSTNDDSWPSIGRSDGDDKNDRKRLNRRKNGRNDRYSRHSRSRRSKNGRKRLNRRKNGRNDRYSRHSRSRRSKNGRKRYNKYKHGKKSMCECCLNMVLPLCEKVEKLENELKNKTAEWDKQRLMLKTEMESMERQIFLLKLNSTNVANGTTISSSAPAVNPIRPSMGMTHDNTSYFGQQDNFAMVGSTGLARLTPPTGFSRQQTQQVQQIQQIQHPTPRMQSIPAFQPQTRQPTQPSPLQQLPQPPPIVAVGVMGNGRMPAMSDGWYSQSNSNTNNINNINNVRNNGINGVNSVNYSNIIGDNGTNSAHTVGSGGTFNTTTNGTNGMNDSTDGLSVFNNLNLNDTTSSILDFSITPSMGCNTRNTLFGGFDTILGGDNGSIITTNIGQTPPRDNRDNNGVVNIQNNIYPSNNFSNINSDFMN